MMPQQQLQQLRRRQLLLPVGRLPRLPPCMHHRAARLLLLQQLLQQRQQQQQQLLAPLVLAVLSPLGVVPLGVALPPLVAALPHLAATLHPLAAALPPQAAALPPLAAALPHPTAAWPLLVVCPPQGLRGPTPWVLCSGVRMPCWLVAMAATLVTSTMATWRPVSLVSPRLRARCWGLAWFPPLAWLLWRWKVGCGVGGAVLVCLGLRV